MNMCSIESHFALEARIDSLTAERDAIGRLIRGETNLLPLDTPLLKTFAELVRFSDENRARLAAAEAERDNLVIAVTRCNDEHVLKSDLAAAEKAYSGKANSD